MAVAMPLHRLDHPPAAPIGTPARNRTTKPATFRTVCYPLSRRLAIAATRGLPAEPY